MVSKDKRALKLIKKRVGTRIHAKMKRGAERRLSHHEERSSQKGLNLSPPNTVNLSRKKKKESDCNPIDLGSIPGWGRSPESEMATHSSILAWEIPWTEEGGGLQFTGLQRVGHD